MNLKILTTDRDLVFLKKKSKPVERITDDLRLFISNMKDAMNNNNGVGLAAPQVGELKRFFIFKFEEEDVAIINPSIIKKSKKRETLEEGCLSIPGVFLPIKRSTNITVKAKDINDNLIVMDLDGFPARVFQHELDHLNGILITDRVSCRGRLNNFLKTHKQKRGK
jgi:peptide deformylase